MNKNLHNIGCKGMKNNIQKYELWQEYSEDQSSGQQELIYEDYIEVKCSDSKCINTLSMSPNEQLIAYGGDDKRLIVIDFKTKEIVKQIRLREFVLCCTFTQDSTIIYCGDWFGFLYAYSINDGYKQIYKQQLYLERGIDIIRLIDNHKVITCSNKVSIIISDTLNFRELIKLDKFHTDWISCIQYHPNNGLIMSCSHDQSIKFFDYKSQKVIINIQNSHNESVYQIQLINNNKILFSRSSNELRQWQVNYHHKNLLLIRRPIQFCICLSKINYQLRYIINTQKY